MGCQLLTFFVNDSFFGIDVTNVQEVTKKMAITPVRKANSAVGGLINLRGNIATAINLSTIFQGEVNLNEEFMTVVFNRNGTLFSLLVDRIGDVVTLPESAINIPPHNSEKNDEDFFEGVYDLEGTLLSIINIDAIIESIK